MADNATKEAPVRNRRKLMAGRVMSSKMNKTITVRIERRTPHPLYEKIVSTYSTLHAHDENNEAKEGDFVEVMETRPLSRTKRWRLVRIIRKAAIR
ncbi:MAG: 30S ribosomal protein S17 [Planctomycetota bacterium]